VLCLLLLLLLLLLPLPLPPAAGHRYNSYSSLWSILGPFLRCMKELGRAPDVPPAAAAAAAAAKAR
jgi:hypothetical protein